MNSTSHLRLEDRPEFERVLEEALRAAPQHRPDVSVIGRRLDNEQLRGMALNAASAIAACAATEYQRFVELREELRLPHHRPSSSGGMHTAGAGTSGVGLAISPTFTEATGAGLMAMLSVLAPILAGTAAAIFLLVGYVLHMVTPEPSIAEPMRNAGWVFAALTAATLLVATIGLLTTALRNNASPAHSISAPGQTTLAEQVSQAREAWRRALLERGILPFLQEALAEQGTTGAAPSSQIEEGRHPRLGYSNPGFSSPGASESTAQAGGTRPRFSSPDFSSPDYDGPGHVSR